MVLTASSMVLQKSVNSMFNYDLAEIACSAVNGYESKSTDYCPKSALRPSDSGPLSVVSIINASFGLV